jgi:hypothetical protein
MKKRLYIIICFIGICSQISFGYDEQKCGELRLIEHVCALQWGDEIEIYTAYYKEEIGKDLGICLKSVKYIQALFRDDRPGQGWKIFGNLTNDCQKMIDSIREYDKSILRSKDLTERWLKAKDDQCIYCEHKDENLINYCRDKRSL